MSFDFAIVGGGIGGAVLANLLDRRGKRVLVLEKGFAPAPQNRPEVLWPATVELLRTLIPESLCHRWMVALEGGEATCGKKTLLRFGPEVFKAAGVQMYSTANTRELLLQQAPCECRRGVEVTGLLHEQGRVAGVQILDRSTGARSEARADWTVGDDGAHSVVRQACGSPMSLVRFPLELLGFAFDWPASLPSPVVRLFVNEQRLRSEILGLAAFPLPEGRGAGLLPVWPEALQNDQRLRKALAELSTQHPLLAELIGKRPWPEGFSRFRLVWSRSPSFGVPGVLLMGDAAHAVTPAGGQGANLSVADALIIAEEALARPDTLLAEYRRRRRAAALRSLSISRAAARVFSLPRWVMTLGLFILPWAARWSGGRPPGFGRLLRFASSAFTENPGSGDLPPVAADVP
jgi:2-polyprenyl-6-methoxyphenol hydroxylase-like FAD-dependent oxidoreductase